MGEVHALLVGIDRYDPPKLPGHLPIRELQGCVRDVERMEAFLRAEPLTLPEGRIRKLVSPSLLDGPAPPAEDLPTYTILIEEIQALGERAQPGDQVLIYHSGHGARVESLSAFKKSHALLDEALVPCDAGAPSGGFLRDVELHALLEQLSRQDLQVTVIFDACHSGGATRGSARGAPGVARTIGTVREQWGPTTSPLGPWNELAAGLERDQERRRPKVRHVSGGSGWFPPPQGTVLLAACLQTQFAKEYLFEGEWGGALTHFLLEAVRDLGGRATYHRLHQRLLGRIRGELESQTPALEGDGDLAFLGCEQWPTLRGVPVLEVSPPSAAERVLLGSGSALGLGAGALLAIHAGESEGSELAQVEVEDPGATMSWARIVSTAPSGRPVSPSDVAMVTDPGATTARRPVWVLQANDTGGPIREVTERLRLRLKERASPHLALWTEGGLEPELLTEVTPEDTFQILDSAGLPLPHQGAPLPARKEESIDRLIVRLEHLARFRDVRDLANPESSALLAQFEVELFAVQDEESGRDPASREPVAGRVVPMGTKLCIEIRNRSERHLFLVVLDLQPDWGIERVHPKKEEGSFVIVEARRPHLIFLDTWFPEGIDEGTDYLKVIVATEPLNGDCLELEPLGSTARDGSAWARSTDPDLRGRLFAAPNSSALFRGEADGSPPPPEWGAETLEVGVRRADRGTYSTEATSTRSTFR